MILKSCLFLIIIVTVVAKTLGADSREKRSDGGDPLEVVVERLTQQVNSLTAQMTQQTNDCNARLDLLNTKLAALKNKTDNLDKTVAFYAGSTYSPISAAALGTLVFDHAFTNVGNAYNTLSGIFTVPVSGLYHIQTTFLSSYLGAGRYVKAAIYVDNTLMAEGVSDTGHGDWDQTTISATIHVNAGQQVYIKNTDNTAKDYYSSLVYPRTTFSGFLLHAD